MQEDEHADVRVRRGHRSGTPFVIAIHTSGDGVALGGCRMLPSESVEDALAGAGVASRRSQGRLAGRRGHRPAEAGPRGEARRPVGRPAGRAHGRGGRAGPLRARRRAPRADRRRPALAAVAGAANNQLATSAVADRLTERGIVWAPDFVVNAGGLISVASEIDGYAPSEARRRTAAISDALAAIFDEADRTGTKTLAAAEAYAKREAATLFAR